VLTLGVGSEHVPELALANDTEGHGADRSSCS
jgi:hypothetical protein